ncbi:MAG TPA: macro domain-containing protein, partial [Calditrichia bacterium]|nr:macro domain-containing protein [Calditrichia bacterium]
LLEACRKIGGCPTGEARITPGFNLPAKWVIHTVGPVWRGGGAGEAQLLQSCYRNSMALAAENRIKSLAFPAISCGVYGYPVDQAAHIAVQTVRESLAAFPAIESVKLVCFGKIIFDAYQTAYSQ